MMNSKLRRHRHHQPRLDRRNAIKNIDYDAADSAPPPPSSYSNLPLEDRSVYKTRSLDLVPLCDRTSFRIEGTEGEVDQIFRHLGLSPDDLSIPVAAWEARKSLSPSSNIKTAKSVERGYFDVPDGFGARIRVSDGHVEDAADLNLDYSQASFNEVIANGGKSKLVSHGDWGIRGIRPSELAPHTVVTGCVVDSKVSSSECQHSAEPMIKLGNGEGMDGNEVSANQTSENQVRSEFVSNVGLGIRGCRPPKLAPPPVTILSVVDNCSSTWDILKAFGPRDEQEFMSPKDGNRHPDDEVDEEEESEDDVLNERGAGLESCSDSSNVENGGSSVSLIGVNKYTMSPSASFRRNITAWQKGDFLGSGSFGTVYEGFTDDGLFFAVKEVSLLDQGSQGQQCIYQLEQEISLLRQFEHENIVRYLGTDRDDAKLYIFLELVTKGSLAKLYGRYQLRDSQVSAYTRQILSGLNYLHSRNVVHRDIKCANILVDVSGSVKLTDFGLAKATKLNDIKSCKGTPFWMAPEVVKRRNDGYGHAADIWSLGCTVLEMLTRQIPYSHLEGGMQALFRIGRGELPPIPNTLSREAQDFILKCLQVNPDNRPTAAQLLEHPFVKKLSSSLPSPAASPHHATR